MTVTEAPETAPDVDDVHPYPPGRAVAPNGIRGAFGPLTRSRVVVLAAAFAFLVGCFGYVVGHQTASADPLSSTDVGFMRDMNYHHDQAVQMSTILLGKPGMDVSIRNYADEIIKEQRFEQGFMNATLDRFGHSSLPEKTVMAWMGIPLPLHEMEGLATDAQMAELTKAQGRDAEALWVALMSEHHLGGLHMADWEARHGKDRTIRNLAQAMVLTQRGEVIDLARFRTTRKLPIPKGFTDPAKDQRLNPLSATTAAISND